MTIKWRNIEEEKPEDFQLCLTKTKYGLISGEYSKDDESFNSYIGHYREWYALKWVPIGEVDLDY